MTTETQMRTSSFQRSKEREDYEAVAKLIGDEMHKACTNIISEIANGRSAFIGGELGKNFIGQLNGTNLIIDFTAKEATSTGSRSFAATVAAGRGVDITIGGTIHF